MDELLEKCNLSFDSTFVPFSKSRNKDSRYRTLNWIVHVRTREAGRHLFDIDYSAGTAHCPAYNRTPPENWNFPDRLWKDYATAWECETGKEAKGYRAYGSTGIDDFYSGKQLLFTGIRQKTTIQPNEEDVLNALVNDSVSALLTPSFEEWADSLGYNPDSNEAKGVYDECLSTGLKLLSAVGTRNFADLEDWAMEQ